MIDFSGNYFDNIIEILETKGPSLPRNEPQDSMSDYWIEHQKTYCSPDTRGKAAYEREFGEAQIKGSVIRKAANKVVHCPNRTDTNCPNKANWDEVRSDQKSKHKK